MVFGIRPVDTVAGIVNRDAIRPKHVGRRDGSTHAAIHRRALQARFTSPVRPKHQTRESKQNFTRT